ncbi:hypothetical protein C3K47_08645 [Solitalea longa]|uniref:DUF4450 domain-containing protein n=1 Tax=Solitalea longa TaxID=2079460 RepID=A0A2S5A3J6_9SPHI|nr:hypothetical protein [Solitalea longa]POY37115.1 hypothetical protein C3K47_08645 [Solitalea longa]
MNYLKQTFLFALLLIVSAANAQNVTGIFMLHGVMETAAGFQLLEDGTFEYFFSYGAADKWGKGLWKKEGNKIIFNSFHKQPLADFKLSSATKTQDKFITLRVADTLNRPYRYVACRLNDNEETTNENGEVRYPLDTARFLQMYHPIFSLRLTTLTLDKDKNSFLIAPTCDLSEVFFDDLSFSIGENEINAAFLPGSPDQPVGSRTFHFKKQQ